MCYAGVVVRMHHCTVGKRVDAPGVLEDLARMYHLVVLLQVAEAVQLQAQLLQLQSSPHLYSRPLLKQAPQRRRCQLAPVVQRGRAFYWFYDLHNRLKYLRAMDHLTKINHRFMIHSTHKRRHRSNGTGKSDFAELLGVPTNEGGGEVSGEEWG